MLFPGETHNSCLNLMLHVRRHDRRRRDGCVYYHFGALYSGGKGFAENKPIDLVEGYQLSELIRAAQGKPIAAAAEPEVKQHTEMICEECGAKLVLRVTRAATVVNPAVYRGTSTFREFSKRRNEDFYHGAAFVR